MLKISNPERLNMAIQRQMELDFYPDLAAVKIAYLRLADEKTQEILKIDGVRPGFHLIDISETECLEKVTVAEAEIVRQITKKERWFRRLLAAETARGKFIRAEDAEIAVLLDGDEGVYLVTYAAYYSNTASIIAREAIMRTLLVTCFVLAWSVENSQLTEIVEQLDYDTIDEKLRDLAIANAKKAFALKN